MMIIRTSQNIHKVCFARKFICEWENIVMNFDICVECWSEVLNWDQVIQSYWIYNIAHIKANFKQKKSRPTCLKIQCLFNEVIK